MDAKKSRYYANAILVDGDGYKVAIVEVREYEDGSSRFVPTRILGGSQELIYDDLPNALSMVKPRWVKGAWQETASDDEIAAARPVQEGGSYIADPRDLAIAELSEQLALTHQAVAELTIIMATGGIANV